MNIVNPKRIKHSYNQSLSATPERVFPLLCPVLEEEWVPGWETELVISKSGVAEKDCIFVTPAEPHSAIWLITHYDPQAYTLEMYKVTPGHTVGKLEIALLADGTDGTTATVAYEYTALGPAGEDFLAGFTEARYGELMAKWEEALNHYLTSGEKIA